MDLFAATELFTQVITYAMIISGVAPCLSMWRSGETKGVPYPFFLVGLSNALFAVGYGLIVDNPTVLQINAVGAFFNVIYITAYNVVCKSKSRPLTMLLGCGCILACIYLYLSRLIHPDHLVDTLGLVLFCISSLMLLTPLLDVKQCMKDQTAANLSLAMMSAGFLCSASWFVYGLLLKDFYIYAPNVCGVFSFLCHFGCVAVYGTKPLPPHTE